MPIEFACPVCSKRFKVDEKHVGRQTSCRACGAAITVPDQGEAALSGDTTGGSTLYDHSQKERRDLGISVGDEGLIESVSEHIERHFGKVDNVYHELISEGIHVDIHVINPTEEQPFYTLVTTGMSELPMTTPPGAEDLAYAELVLCLPADWKLSQEDFEDESSYWPIRWMKILARFPHDYETFFTLSHTIPGGNPPEEFDPSTPMGCWMFVPPLMFEEESWELQHEGHTINFLYMQALHLDEMEYKLKQGYDEAGDRLLNTFNLLELMDMQRPSFCHFETSGDGPRQRKQLNVQCACGEKVAIATAKGGSSIPCPQCGKAVYVPVSTLAQTGQRPEGAAASHPAGVRINHLRYFQFYPVEILWWAIPSIPLALLGQTIHWGFYVPIVIMIGLFALRCRIVSSYFRDGDTCPGVIVSMEPPLLAVLTNVSADPSFDEPIMVIKVQAHKLKTVGGEPAKVGQRIVSAAFYEEDAAEKYPAEPKRWGDFFPTPIEYGTSDPAAIDYVKSQVSDESWRQLKDGLKQVPRPFAPGIYDIQV
ncbi:DUF3239 domain-containing protein [Blastopirellula retiformator]|uniref:Suppressor of fused protein (SUFU) n=1 Tax=Blastopirellula retiformator TaxID=2527970 RepID=A0A5C5VI91_9BACT|nr:DUF3239 domain-containing protein [Blastopirellula retiformator]TWT38354.1 Suppressor of fused protein (SUFU) [Blastopirellula retiformator]